MQQWRTDVVVSKRRDSRRVELLTLVMQATVLRPPSHAIADEALTGLTASFCYSRKMLEQQTMLISAPCTALFGSMFRKVSYSRSAISEQSHEKVKTRTQTKNTGCYISIGQSSVVPGVFRGHSGPHPPRRWNQDVGENVISPPPQRGQPARVRETPLAACFSAPGHPTDPTRERVALFKFSPRLVRLEIAQAETALSRRWLRSLSISQCNREVPIAKI